MCQIQLSKSIYKIWKYLTRSHFVLVKFIFPRQIYQVTFCLKQYVLHLFFSMPLLLLARVWCMHAACNRDRQQTGVEILIPQPTSSSSSGLCWGIEPLGHLPSLQLPLTFLYIPPGPLTTLVSICILCFPYLNSLFLQIHPSFQHFMFASETSFRNFLTSLSIKNFMKWSLAPCL